MSDSEEEGDVYLDPNDIVKVIDLDGNAIVDNSGNNNQNQDGDGEVEDSDEDAEMETEDTEDGGAAAGPVQDDSQLTFSGHKEEAVMCTHINPGNTNMVVTGGQDDQALVWSVRDGAVLFSCTGHTDTVVGVAFSHDGSMVATGDMKGLIKVWKVETGEEIWSFEVSEINWLVWHHAAPVLLSGTSDGQVWMWKIPSGDCKTFAGYGPAALCGCILPDGKRAFVGYEDGVMKMWDLKSSEALFALSGHDAHKDSVFCIDYNNDGSLVCSGAGDVTVKVVSTVNGKVVANFKCTEKEDEEDSVEAVGFCKTPGHPYLATGTLSGNLEIWDLPSKTVRHKCEHPYGIVKLKWSASSPTLYTVCLDGSVRCFDGRNGQLLKTMQGHSAGILDFDVARDDSYVLTGSDDFTAKIFPLKETMS